MDALDTRFPQGFTHLNRVAVGQWWNRLHAVEACPDLTASFLVGMEIGHQDCMYPATFIAHREPESALQLYRPAMLLDKMLRLDL